MKVSHKARNDDKELLVIYMQKFGMGLSAKQIEVFRKMPSMETIRRSRQIIQEQGRWRADEEVEQARYEKYKDVKRGIHHEDVEQLLEKQGYKILPWKEG